MRSFLGALRMEIKLDFFEYLQYKVTLFIDFIIFTGIFIAIYYMGVAQKFTVFYNIDASAGVVLVLIGYIIWQNSASALGYSSGIIEKEANQGILEMRLQSKFSITLLWFCRLVISVLIHLVTYIGIIIFGTLVSGIQVKDIGILCVAVMISLPSLVGMYGMGLIFGGITIREKSVGSLILIVQTALLIATNTLSPTRNEITYLVPFSMGTDIVRKIYLRLQVGPWEIIFYIAVNLFWLLIGIFWFKRMLEKERKYGTFDSY